MKSMIIFCTLALTWASSRDFRLASSIYNGSSVKFIKHEGSGAFDNYLAMNLLFEPVSELFRQLSVQERVLLKNRGEAHITVITPVEYWNILRPRGITIHEINQLAEKFSIQRSRFKVSCLGQGRAKIDKKLERTFFVVVESEDLFKIRKGVYEIFVNKGGAPADFDPAKFYPHITIGFTKTDLHESHGVIKDARSCGDKITMTR